MTPSIQTLMKKFKAVIFEKDEFEHRDMSKLMALLPLSAYQGSDSSLKNNFEALKEIDGLPEEKRHRLISSWKNEAGRAVKRSKIEYVGMSKLIALFGIFG